MTHHKPSPFLAPLIATITGIALSAWFNISMTVLVLGAIGTCAGSLFLFFKHTNIRYARLILYLFFGCIGALMLHLQKLQTIHQQSAIINQSIDLYATVIDKDVWGTHQQSDILRLTATSVHFLTTQQTTPVSFDLFCYLPYHAHFKVGDTITIKNIVINPQNIPSRSGNPGYEDYLAKEQILCSLFLHSAGQCSLSGRPSWSIARWIWELRQKSYFALKKKLSPTAFRYVGLIFFGNKQQPSITQLRSTFNMWGLAHFLARAGLHIVFFIFIWTSFLKIFPIPLALKRFILILLCFAYNMLSWSSIPFARALYAFLCIKSGELLLYQTYYLHILSLICLTILLFNPLQLFFLDFQLSFGLTFALIFLAQLSHSMPRKIR